MDRVTLYDERTGSTTSNDVCSIRMQNLASKFGVADAVPPKHKVLLMGKHYAYFNCKGYFHNRQGFVLLSKKGPSMSEMYGGKEEDERMKWKEKEK